MIDQIETISFLSVESPGVSGATPLTEVEQNQLFQVWILYWPECMAYEKYIRNAY